MGGWGIDSETCPSGGQLKNYTPRKLTSWTQKLMVWVDVSTFPRGIFKFHLSFGGCNNLSAAIEWPQLQRHEKPRPMAKIELQAPKHYQLAVGKELKGSRFLFFGGVLQVLFGNLWFVSKCSEYASCLHAKGFISACKHTQLAQLTIPLQPEFQFIFQQIKP